MTNEAALLAIVRPAIAEKPTAYWSERLREADIMHERLNSFREFLRHPQAEAIGLVSWLEPPGTPEPIPVPNIAGIAPFAKGTPRATPPLLGQHTTEVLRRARLRRRRHRRAHRAQGGGAGVGCNRRQPYCTDHGRSGAIRLRLLRPTKKIEQQARDGLGLLLLHPVAGTVDEMAGEHARAGLLLHALEGARRLEDAPVARP